MPNPSNSIWSRLLRTIGVADLIVRVPQPPLIDRGLGLIYDTERNITWLQDANYAKTVGHSRDGQMTWAQAMSWVTTLNYRGIRGWRLPSALNSDGSGPCHGNNCSDSELGHIFLDVNKNTPGLVQWRNATVPCIYWMSTEASGEEAYAFDLFNLRQGLVWKDPFAERFPNVPLSGPVLSWPVHDGDVAAELRAGWLTRILSFVTRAFRR
jgi:hypothetical protein